MSNIFFTSDFHYNHMNILKFTKRGDKWSNIYEMNDALISRWNAVVGKKDFVYILGDFTWDRCGWLLNVLNGKKYMIEGNHDSEAKKYIKCFSGWSQIKEIKLCGRKIVLCHFPLRSWNGCNSGSALFFGHCHGRMNTFNLSFDVGVDVPQNNYAPICIDEMLRRIKLRETEMIEAGRIRESEINGKKVTVYFQDDCEFLAPGKCRNKEIK